MLLKVKVENILGDIHFIYSKPTVNSSCEKTGNYEETKATKKRNTFDTEPRVLNYSPCRMKVFDTFFFALNHTGMFTVHQPPLAHE